MRTKKKTLTLQAEEGEEALEAASAADGAAWFLEDIGQEMHRERRWTLPKVHEKWEPQGMSQNWHSRDLQKEAGTAGEQLSTFDKKCMQHFMCMLSLN